MGEPGKLDGVQRKRFGAMLRGARHAIPPHTTTLRWYLRAHDRVGHVVAIEEIADAIGVNHRWYALLEEGEQTRTPAVIIANLADVFGLTLEQRTELFNHATPEIPSDEPREASQLVFEAFGSMRNYARKLVSASTVEEVLDLAQDAAGAHFPEVSLITAVSRTGLGTWEPHGEGIGSAATLRRMHDQFDRVHRPLMISDPLGLDQIMCFPSIALPGELMTFWEHDSAALSRILGDAKRGYTVNNSGQLIARIRSRSGYVGHLFFADFCNAGYDASEYAFASAIAEFASLAL